MGTGLGIRASENLATEVISQKMGTESPVGHLWSRHLGSVLSTTPSFVSGASDITSSSFPVRGNELMCVKCGQGLLHTCWLFMMIMITMERMPSEAEIGARGLAL